MYIPNIFFNRRNLLSYILGINIIMNENNDRTILSQNNNKLYFYGPLTDESCFKLYLTLDNMITDNSNEDINFYIQTSGGSVLPTFPIVDLIKNSPTPINTYVNGYCASAGTLLSVVGRKRYITKNSLLLIHSLHMDSGGGNFNNIKDQYDNANMIMDNIKNIYLNNTNFSKIELDYYLNHDLWINSEDCLKYNIVDEII